MGRSSLRLEDLALAVVNVAAVPLLAAVGGTGSGSPAPLLGLIELVAVLGAIAALATRAPGSQPLDADGLHGWLFAGPLLGGVGLVGGDASDHLGIDASGALGLLTFGAVVGAFALGDRLPVLPEPRRRLLVTPFIIVASGWFTAFAGDLFDGLDLRDLARVLFGPEGSPELVSIAGIVAFAILAGSAVFYAMLIVAPRELASREPQPRVWLVRYLVFVVSAAIGAGGAVLV